MLTTFVPTAAHVVTTVRPQTTNWSSRSSRNGWSQTMAAKPPKCIASGLKGGKPFDPELKVWESEGKWFPKYLDDGHFKHLGKDLLADFSEAQAKKVLAKLNEYVCLVDGTLLNAIPKLWIWANYVVHKISWLFLKHDFPPSFVESTLQPIERRTLKKWGGLPKSGDLSIFCLLYTSPSPRDRTRSRMPSSA